MLISCSAKKSYSQTFSHISMSFTCALSQKIEERLHFINRKDKSETDKGKERQRQSY